VVAFAPRARYRQHLLHVADRKGNFNDVAFAVEASSEEAAFHGAHGVSLRFRPLRVSGEKSDSGSCCQIITTWCLQ